MMKTAIRHQDLLLASGEQSREADRRTIESYGITGDTLMEIAGNRAADLIMDFFMEEPDRDGQSGNPFSEMPRVLFVCGKGNNAGDAFVIARILMGYGFSVSLLPVLGTDRLSPDAQRNFDRLIRLSREMESEVTVCQKWPGSDHCDLIVDGIFGTGLERAVDPPVSGMIDRINRSEKPVVALDIPSGIHSDTGEVLGCAVRAEKTIQFGIQKLGCYIGDGPAYSGERLMSRLPFSPVFKQSIRARLLDMSLQPMRALRLPERGHDGRGGRIKRNRRHKYDNGVVHVIGGSSGLTGAPMYAAQAAWSLGMGAVTLLHPAAWSLAMETRAPELIKRPVGDTDSEYFTGDDADGVLSLLEEKEGVVVIGPGIGRRDETASFVRRIIAEFAGPIIIDADALHFINGFEHILSEKGHPGQVILTPHPGELAVLGGKKAGTDHERLMDASALSERLGCVLLSKGSPTTVHSPSDRQLLVTPYDTTVFSRAGFGDTLAGHLAAFLSRTGDPFASCELALLHGYQRINEAAASGKAFPEPSDLT